MAQSGYEGLSLPYVLPIEKSELIAGFVHRSMRAGGHVRMKDLAMTLVNRQTIQPPWSIPSNLKRLSEQLRPLFGSAEELMLGHTCLPAYLPFAANGAATEVLQYVYEGGEPKMLAPSLGLAGKYVTTKPAMAICPDCIREDKLRVGFAFFHREHALAGVTYCCHHGLPLLVGCGTCRFSQEMSRVARWPDLECGCGQPLKRMSPAVSAEDGEVLARVAVLAFQLLSGALNDCNATKVGRYYQWRAIEAGFHDGTRISSGQVSKLIRETYSTDVLYALNASIGRMDWPAFILGKGVASPVLGRNLLLFDFFGQSVPTVDEIASAEEDYQRRMTARAWSRARKQEGTGFEKPVDRESLLLYLAANPEATRQAVLDALGKLAVRLRDLDGNWYEDVMPPSRRGQRTETAEEARETLDQADDRASTHIYRRRNELLSNPSDKPKKITKTALTKGLPQGNSLSKARLAIMPKTRDALTDCVESKTQFKKRFAALILSQAGDLSELLTVAMRRTGLSMEEVQDVSLARVEKHFGTS